MLFLYLQVFCSLFGFIAFFTRSLTDFKLKSITTNTDEEIKQNGSHRLIAYNAFFNQIGDGSVTSTISLLLNFILDALTQPTLSNHCLKQAILLWTLLCHNAHTSRVLVTLPLVQDIIIHHNTLQLTSMLAPSTLRFRPPFYASLTELLLLKAVPGDLEHFCSPFVTTITTLLTSPCNQQNMDTLVVCLRDVTGVLRSCTSSYNYTTVVDLLSIHLGPFIPRCTQLLQLIHEYLTEFWNNSSFIVASLRFCAEVSSFLFFLLTHRKDRKQRVDTDDPSPRVVLLFKAIADFISSYCRIVMASSMSGRTRVCFPAFFQNLAATVFAGCDEGSPTHFLNDRITTG